MNEKKHELLTSGQTIGLLIGFAIGPEFLRLPNLLVEKAGQDGWMSAAVAVVQPLYIVLIASIIIKHHPKENIITLNKKYFGKMLGSIFSIIFILQYVIYAGSIVSEFSRISRIYIVAFLTPLKISAACIVISLYAAWQGIKTLGKISEVSTYFIAVVLVMTLFIFKEGSMLNLRPVFQADIGTILKTTVKTFYFYAGFEALLVIHPLIKEKGKIRSSAIKAVLISSFVWAWSVFATIYYLGIDIIPKTLWSFFYVYDSINLPIINNVRYIFMFVWALVTFRIVANYMFLGSYMIENITGINIKKVYYVVVPVIFYLSIKFADSILRQKIFNVLSPAYVIFNLILITTLVLFVKYRSGKAADSRNGQ